MPAVVDKLAWHRFTPQHVGADPLLGAFLGFAVKVPLVPFHTWLPAAYAEAPSGTTMLLTGAMSKMGVYGFLRILLPIFFPQMQMVLTPLLWLAVATIVLSACAAFAQNDLKRIFAYSSINHLGYCLLAIFAVAKFTGGDAALTAEKAAALNGVCCRCSTTASPPRLCSGSSRCSSSAAAACAAWTISAACAKSCPCLPA